MQIRRYERNILIFNGRWRVHSWTEMCNVELAFIHMYVAIREQESMI